MNEHARKNALSAAAAAGLMLFLGWFASFDVTSASAPEFFRATVALCNWTLRIGGFAMAVVAILCFFGKKQGLLLDGAVSGASGMLLLFCAIYWIGRSMAGKLGLDLQDIVIAVVALLLLRNASISFAALRAGPSPAVGEIVAPPPPHPASVHPDSLPAEGQPPPPEGYLAALARESKEPPTASYE